MTLYDPKIIDLFEDPTDPLVAVIKELVGRGLLGFAIDEDGSRLRYFAINRSDPFWSRGSTPDSRADDQVAVG